MLYILYYEWKTGFVYILIYDNKGGKNIGLITQILLIKVIFVLTEKDILYSRRIQQAQWLK